MKWLIALLVVCATGCRSIEALDPAPPFDELSVSDQSRVKLGQRLFFEPRLSADGQHSCASCHAAEHAGADVGPVSFGVAGQAGLRNAPTVYNTSVRTRWFWDGRAATLEEQALGPLFGAAEMGTDEQTLLEFLHADPNLVGAFAAAFPGDAAPITVRNVTVALAAYERQLVVPSRVDRHLRGEADVLDAAEERGLEIFQGECTRCHDGPGLGGSRSFKLGIAKPWPAERSADLGLMEVTGNEEDRLTFVVPSLRNVGRTAPYLHDGSVATLEETIRLMGTYQVGTELAPADVDDLAAFLRALDGSPAPEWTTAP